MRRERLSYLKPRRGSSAHTRMLLDNTLAQLAEDLCAPYDRPDPVAKWALSAGRRQWSPYDPEGLEHIEVGRVLATGEPWELDVIANHILIAGASRSGKSSLIWALLAGLLPFMKAGLVEVVAAIDPKGGYELGLGGALFRKLVYGKGWEKRTADLLSEVIDSMYERAEPMVGEVRKHTPRMGEPLRIILFDELAAINAIEDPKARNAILRPLRQLMEQGAGAGYIVLGAIQDPRKETIPFRDYFLTKIGLRIPDAGVVDLVLGTGARARGAECDRIPRKGNGPGTAYFVEDGGDPVKVRAFYVDDNAVRRMAADYGRV